MKKLIRGFGYAFKGFWYAAKTQLNFRVHLVAALTAITMGFYFNISTTEWCFVALCIAMVLLTELLNTSVEILTDMVSPDYHPKAGHIKDIAAAAVLITAIFALATGLIIFVPKIKLLITHAA